MRLFKNIKLNLLILFLCCNSISFSQQFIATPLEPAKQPTQRETGLFIGLGPNWQSGSFNSICNCPAFEDGTKFGFSVGGIFEQDLSSQFQWGGLLLYNNLNIMASYKQYELIEATSQTNNTTELTKIPFRQAANADFSAFSLVPYFKWSPLDFLFLKIGVSASYIFYSNLNHTKELLQTSARLSNGETVSIKTEHGTLETIYDGAFPGLNAVQFGIEPMLGFNFNLSKNVYLSPGFQFSVPLTKLTSNGDGFSVNYWRIFLEIRIALQMRTKFN